MNHSKVGIASFIVAVCATVLILGTFVAAGILKHGHGPGTYPGATFVGFAMIGALFVDAAAFVLGLVSVFQKEYKKVFGILGLCISGMTALGAIGLIVIGLLMVMLKRA